MKSFTHISKQWLVINLCYLQSDGAIRLSPIAPYKLVFIMLLEFVPQINLHNRMMRLVPQCILELAHITALMVLMITVLLGGCMQEDVVLPKEGDVVTWKQNPQLIIKAKLGQRREHIPSTCAPCEADFYRPEREHYVGQFPIDYVPEKFAPISKEEADKLPMPYSDHQLEFSLMLNGVKGKATDRSIYSEEGLDDINQVKVMIENYGLSKDGNSTTKDGQERFLKSKEGRYDKTSSDEYGLTCHYQTRVTGLSCFGKSNSPHISGVNISFMSGNWARGQSWEPVYGGIHVEWRFHRRNLKHWKEIDTAIWRLLETWNVSPLSN